MAARMKVTAAPADERISGVTVEPALFQQSRVPIRTSFIVALTMELTVLAIALALVVSIAGA